MEKSMETEGTAAPRVSGGFTGGGTGIKDKYGSIRTSGGMIAKNDDGGGS